MKNKSMVLFTFLIGLIPSSLLNIINFIRQIAIYKNIFISPKSYLFNCKLGKSILIGGGVRADNVTIGDYSYIAGQEGGGFTSHLSNVEIGKFCSIGHNLQVLNKGHNVQSISTYPFISSVGFPGIKSSGLRDQIVTKVTIGNDVWIGANVTILGGITIGDGAVIGAASVVTKDVKPYAIVAGNPAKIIRDRFSRDEAVLLQEIKWWDWDINRIRNHIPKLLDDRINELTD